MIKPLYVSRHARRRMHRHGISEEDIIAVLSHPDQLLESVKGRRNAVRMVEGRLIRVTYPVCWARKSNAELLWSL
ncbi:MAG: DUF4258 domain-containing protein [Chloroflexi bacterium]|nr:DUF4258 domain-containing protein [Chloroflexota bacterium]